MDGPKQTGKFIVFEGIDGSGKTTQAKLLHNYLLKSKVPCAYISFPRYEKSMWGAIVRRYLNGEFGKLDGYLASLMYAGDRFSASGEIRNWLENGKIVVCDRYVASSIGHQAAKFSKLANRNKFIKWLEDLEYVENDIPREDLVIFLNLSVEFAQKLMKDRKSLDIHESDLEHLKNASLVYCKIAKERNYWEQIDVCGRDILLSKDEIAGNILKVLRKKKFL